MTLLDRVRALQADGRLDLPPIGGGHTAGRWRALAELARANVSEARIAEAHVDAVQILGEAGRPVPTGALFGVWASEHPRWTVTGTVVGDRIELVGAKAFCTGAGLVDRALITADVDGRHTLLLVPLHDLPAGRIDASGWANHALADTVTAVVDLTGLAVPTDAQVGADRWYLDRPGFWDGAIGPAACWAGAALGLVDHAADRPPSDPHGRAHLGALHALAWELGAVLDQAGSQIDAGAARAHIEAPDNRAAHRRALVVRHLVDAACAEVQDRFARALGPRPLVADPAVIERDHALSLYRRQSHAERDLEALGDLTADRPST